MNLKLDFDVDSLLIKLVLPEGATLKKPIKDGDITSASIYPKPSEATTDGRSLIFYWLEKDMKQGETKTVTLEPKDAFGIHNDELVAEIPKKNLSDTANLDVGSKVQMKTASEKIIQGMIMEIKDTVIIVDFNHPLVGRKIIFTVTIMSIEKN